MRPWNFRLKYLFSTSFSRRKVFENRLNTFGNIAFSLTQCRAWKWEISNFSTRKNFSPYHCKTKIAAPMKFLRQIPIFHIFQQKESFCKSVEYLWWYSIFSYIVYSLKVGNYNFSTWKKFLPYRCKTKIVAAMEFSAQIPIFNIF